MYSGLLDHVRLQPLNYGCYCTGGVSATAFSRTCCVVMIFNSEESLELG